MKIENWNPIWYLVFYLWLKIFGRDGVFFKTLIGILPCFVHLHWNFLYELLYDHLLHSFHFHFQFLHNYQYHLRIWEMSSQLPESLKNVKQYVTGCSLSDSLIRGSINSKRSHVAFSEYMNVTIRYRLVRVIYQGVLKRTTRREGISICLLMFSLLSFSLFL